MEKTIGYITSLIGDPVRTNILWTLLDGRAYTASELAVNADTSAQNISMHLSKLVQAELLSVESQGRHKYFRLSRQEVAYAIEALGSLIPTGKHKQIIGDKDNVAIKFCRTCYDHLAGKVGVLVTEKLVLERIIQLNADGYAVTVKGRKFFLNFGIDSEALKTYRRTFAKPCLDWSERKHHMAGSLGAALFDKMLSLDWLRKMNHSRAIKITSKGREQLYEVLEISL